MKVVSTFAGCGGSSTGYKQAGCEVVAMIEWDRHAAECYALNHPTTPILQGDIAKISGADILRAAGLSRGDLDVLDGSPPCQGFSSSGRRILDDPRNSLFREQMRLIRELQPRHVVIENVAGMVTDKMRPIAAEIFKAIEAEGYRVRAGLIQATAFGVPQYRPRVFFVGSRGGLPQLPLPTHTRAVTAAEALADVPPEIEADSSCDTYRFMTKNLRPGENGADARRRLGLSPSFYAHIMLDPNKPARTLLKESSHHIYHWSRRYITIREALVLTGFPLAYQLTGSRSQRWARIGNSVAPPVTAAIARSLRGVVREDEEKPPARPTPEAAPKPTRRGKQRAD